MVVLISVCLVKWKNLRKIFVSSSEICTGPYYTMNIIRTFFSRIFRCEKWVRLIQQNRFQTSLFLRWNSAEKHGNVFHLNSNDKDSWYWTLRALSPDHLFKNWTLILKKSFSIKVTLQETRNLQYMYISYKQQLIISHPACFHCRPIYHGTLHVRH